MYQLQIWGPKGERILRWDPRKLAERDPRTLALFAEADHFLKEAYTLNRKCQEMNQPSPCMTACGRWLE